MRSCLPREVLPSSLFISRPAQHRRKHRHASSTAKRQQSTSAAPSDVFVLDFDGVICDSEPEGSTSAYDAAAQHWPQLFSGLAPTHVAAVKQGLQRSRPRLVEGYEAMVMARLILESQKNVDRILVHWDDLLEASLASWGEDPDRLKALLEHHRRACMRGSQEEWMALNPLFPGVAEALKDCPYPFYIASSKAASRLVVLLQAGLPGVEGLGEGSPRIFSSLLPPNEKKVEALRAIMSRPLAQDPSTSLHFVDDRYETLEAISRHPDLCQRWKLYLATWGYNTEAEKAAVAEGGLPGVRPLSLRQLCELLRWGLVIGVDDGCEPTAEEVEEGVYGRTSSQSD